MRFYWVAAKWLLGVALVLSALFWQGPIVARLAADADLGHAAWRGANLEARSVALVLLGLVAVVFVVSTFKPWGRWRETTQPPRRRTVVLVWALTAAVVAASLGQSFALDRVRALVIAPVDLSRVADGRHRGRADPEPGFEYVVEVDVRRGRLVRARAVRNRTGAYPRLAAGVLERVVAEQSVAVDAVTGATTTSKCLLAATRAALEAGRLRP